MRRFPLAWLAPSPVWAVVLLGCSSDVDAPDDCGPGQLHYVHGTTDASVVLANLSFVNVFGSNTVGTLELGDIGGNAGTDRVVLQFDKLVAHGEIVSARGFVKVGTLAVGNCETGPFTGLLKVDDDGDGWRFELDELHAPPYCSGAAIAESISACYRKAN